MNATPLQDVDSPVSIIDLSLYLDAPASNPMLEVALNAATEIAIAYVGLDFKQRDWRYVMNAKRYPRPSLARLTSDSEGWLELPFTNLVSVNSVEIDGESLSSSDYEVDTESRPGRIGLNIGLSGRQLVIEYTAGYPNDQVPAGIIAGITMLAAFLFEHGAACDVDDALMKSGAKMALDRFRVYAVL